MARRARFAAGNRRVFRKTMSLSFTQLCGALDMWCRLRRSRTLVVRCRPSACASAIRPLRVGPQQMRELDTRRGRKRCKTRFQIRLTRYNTTRHSIRTDSACRASRTRQTCDSPRIVSAARRLCSRAERVHTHGNRDTASCPSASLKAMGQMPYHRRTEKLLEILRNEPTSHSDRRSFFPSAPQKY